MPTVTLAHSPDADDVVMFRALATGAVDVGEFTFEITAGDVETLNQAAVDGGPYHITAISAAAYPLVQGAYAITACGGSFGEGRGPKVVVRADDARTEAGDLAGARVATPGVHTTAFLVASLMIGRDAFEAAPMHFQAIPEAVARADVDAGLLIHEAQLTLEGYGLREVADLGAWWHARTGLALPLGLNVIRRDCDTRFGDGALGSLSMLCRESIVHARTHPEDARRYLADRAHERGEWADDELVQEYLAMYVSEMTVDMGEAGRAALRRLYDEAANAGLCARVGVLDVV